MAVLPVLASTPLVVVCAGAKSILDLSRTLEYLETWGVPVLGWRTGEFPAFYSRASGLAVDQRVDPGPDFGVGHSAQTRRIQHVMAKMNETLIAGRGLRVIGLQHRGDDDRGPDRRRTDPIAVRAIDLLLAEAADGSLES